jgi:hypothetical protein
MSPWEVIGWAIAVPMITLSSLFVIAVSVAVARGIALGARRTNDEHSIVSDDHPSNVTPFRK